MPSSIYEDTKTNCEKLDVLNIRPLNTSTYSALEHSALELWRQQVDIHLANRFAEYAPPAVRAAKSSASLSLLVSGHGHKVFKIPELLDLILDLAGSSTQVVALEVSEKWRSSAVSVISSCKNLAGFRFARPTEPIEYAQLIEVDISESQPGPEEMEQFRAQLHELLERRRRTMDQRRLYFPARYTQRRDFPDDIAHTPDTLDPEQTDGLYNGTVSTSRDTDVFWLDLSQVQINPYFNHLFALHDRIQHRFGRWEITLSPSHALSVEILDRTPTTDLLLDLIGSMHVTNPPCKTLGIYHVDGGFEPYPSYNKLLHRVNNDSGVRIAELGSALKGCASTVVSSWKLRVEELRTRVARSH